MGTALQKQMEELRAAGKQFEANRVAAAFAKFLDKIRAQEGEANWPTRIWLAQTYYSMGTEQLGTSRPPGAVAPTGEALSKAGRDYVTKARDAYQQLLTEISKDPKLAPSDTAALAVKMQLGECYRALGEYDKSLDSFYDILKEKETSLAVQRAAALAYQDRGRHDDAKYFENAIHGGYVVKATGQNRIWGWLKISQVAGQAAKQDEKFNDAFYEARLNISRCRYFAAMKQTGNARRQDLIKAKQTIQSVAQLYPELGGDKWKPQFEQLLKDIEREEQSIPADSKG
jgi:tetratricopeptide (TPR) repeat protein